MGSDRVFSSAHDEMVVLGFAIDHKESLDRLLSEMTEDHFTEPETNAMFNGILKIIDQNGALSYKVLGNTIHNKELAMEAMLIRNRTASPDEAFDTVHACYQRRGYRDLADRLMKLTFVESFDPKEAENMILDYMPGNPLENKKKHFIEMPEAVDAMLAELDEAMKTPGQIKGISFAYDLPSGSKVGFKGLDSTMMGLKPGDLIMFAAKSGHGKTALAMNLSRIMSHHNRKRVHYLNTEMDEGQMVRRWTAQSTLIPYTRLEMGDIQNYERENVGKWAEEFKKAPLTISQISSLNIDLTVGLAKRAIKKYGNLDCLIVDYIGRMDVEFSKGMQEYQMMYENTKRLKELARDLGIPIIALAQLTQEGRLEGAQKMRNELDGLFYFKPKETKSKDDTGQVVIEYSDTEYFLTKEKVRRNGTKDIIRVEFEKEFQLMREV